MCINEKEKEIIEKLENENKIKKDKIDELKKNLKEITDIAKQKEIKNEINKLKNEVCSNKKILNKIHGNTHVVDYIKGVKILGTILLINIIGILLIANVQILIPILLVFNFFSTLGLANYLSGTNPYNTGEFRQAITITFMFAYFSIIFLALFSGNSDIISSIGNSNNKFFTDFSWITGTIIVSYFGSRALQAFWDKNKSADNKTTDKT